MEREGGRGRERRDQDLGAMDWNVPSIDQNLGAIDRDVPTMDQNLGTMDWKVPTPDRNFAHGPSFLKISLVRYH